MQNYLIFQHPYPILDHLTSVQSMCCPAVKLLQVVENQSNTIKHLQEQICELKNYLQKLEDKIQSLPLIQSNDSENRNQNVKVRRKYFDNKYQCPYQQCEKNYGSTLALNLHIKQKHNGGTKKQREAYAKIIFSCEEKGIQAPLIECDFPPGFLQTQRKKYFKHS